MSSTFILVLSCANRPGIVSSVAGAISRNRGDILEAQQFDDPETGRFFMRVEFAVPSDADAERARASLEQIASEFGMGLRMRRRGERRKVLILVSKFDHCLQDLLYRQRVGDLDMDVVGIVSNHPVESLPSSPDAHIPFHHLPIAKDTKREQEQRILRLVEETSADLVILARYMQILSEEMSSALSGRCINIHHSFLPGFKGAKPYHQAHARGVKMIGATAHYVTSDLDEGPIIVQDVEEVSHADSVEELVRKGRDIERRVLARAVRHHLDDRVLPNGQKTVVFRP
jgi:formyltetrahydrofolate deformylase